LNDAIQATGAETATPEATRQAVASLIDEELLVQDALRGKLDRDPSIVQALEHARRQVLARAYAERAIYPKTAISVMEVEKYYRNNPALFENRKLYRGMVFTLQSADVSEALDRDLESAHSADAVRGVLEKHEIRFETQLLDSAAENLPLDKVAQFAQANVGDLLSGRQPNGGSVLISLTSIDPRPLSFERAKPMIENYLLATRNSRTLKEHLKDERAAARISYGAGFTQDGAEGGPSSAAAQSARQGQPRAAGDSTRNESTRAMAGMN
jgi:EpsD family peptidyl-prolyl cis-trans isomerase